MITELLPFSESSAKKAADILAAGGVVGIPTETVYGLAADARNEAAVHRIFEAKGRPQDNPLIVHISRMEQLESLVRGELPELALRIAERFWPGALTMIFPKSDAIPAATSGGLDTVAIRMPSSSAARAIIDTCGFPLAAPSANISGSPSPTTAQHVFRDMDGRIPLIIDGGECECGVESTVLCFVPGGVRILRPGAVTAEMLSELCGTVIDPAVTAEPPKGAKVLSPGMKYKHYSPKAEVYIVNAHGEKFEKWCIANAKGKTIALIGGNTELTDINCQFRCFGSDPQEQAHRLFSLLREADDEGADTVYVEMPSTDGIGLAVYNRLLRAAAFRVVEIDG